jgi:hypothetical protein
LRAGSLAHRAKQQLTGPPGRSERARPGAAGYARAVVVPAVRYGIPAALILAGQVIVIVTGDVVSWAGFTGAGLALLLIGALVRIGIEGDRERDREEAAREYFSKHGRWPDDEGSGGLRR